MKDSTKRKLRKLFHNPKQYFRDMKILRPFFHSDVAVEVVKGQNALPPAKPTAAKPAPAKPTAAKPAPAKPTAAKPAPAKPTAPAKPVLTPNDLIAKNVQDGVNNILNFIRAYPVNSIRRKDVVLWPAIRFYLTLAINLAARNKLVSGKFYIPIPSPVWIEQYRYDKDAYLIEEYEWDEPVDFLVFSGNKSLSWCDVDDLCYDRLLDPLIDKLKSYGTVKKFTMVTSNGKLREKFYFKPEYLLFASQYAANNYLTIDNFEQFTLKLTAYFSKLKLTRADIVFYMDIFSHLYNSYVCLLRKLKPKAVFFFPIDYNGPLILAAKTLGIVSVDVQHGNIIGYNLPYNNWEECPRKGYDLFPDAIFVWGEREKKHVNKEFKQVKPVIAGYPWLDYPIVATRRSLKKLENFCSEFDFIVGVSLSEHAVVPQLILDIADDARAMEKNIGFIFKRNPKRNNTLIPDRYNLYTDDLVTVSPFFSLTKYMHLHITEASTCLYEADYAGLQTFITGNDWKLHFEELVTTGRLTHLASVDDFYEYFDEAVSCCLFPRLVDNNNDEFNSFILNIMGA